MNQSVNLRVILMLEPTNDGDETSPAWMANGRRWRDQLQERLACKVELERIDGPLPAEFEIDGNGLLVVALNWRDSTCASD